jgi:hypothetical protein
MRLAVQIGPFFGENGPIFFGTFVFLQKTRVRFFENGPVGKFKG